MKFDGCHQQLDAHTFLGPIVLILFIFIVIFVCLSMSLTIITKHFRQTHDNLYSFELFNQRIDLFLQILNRVRYSSRTKDSHVFFLVSILDLH